MTKLACFICEKDFSKLKILYSINSRMYCFDCWKKIKEMNKERYYKNDKNKRKKV